MIMSVQFHDNRVQVKAELKEACEAFLHEASSEIVSESARSSPVDIGQLRGSWKANVNASEGEATIGSELENAIWNEFGTGEYAAKGDGRKTPWSYQDRHGEWHRTTGKRPQHTLENAFEQKKSIIKKRLEDILKERFGR